MSDEQQEKIPFSINLKDLKTRPKDLSPEALAKADSVGEVHGFVGRQARRRGRLPSPRTGQVHAKVMPHISDEIADEAKRRGVQQGVVLEEAWELYKKAAGLITGRGP